MISIQYLILADSCCHFPFHVCVACCLLYRIELNVEDTFMNVEAAHSEILKYFQSVTSNRWLMIKIFSVLIVFFITFVVSMA